MKVRIADGVEALEFTANLMGRETTIYATLFWDDNTAVLVDAGFPGTEQRIEQAVEKAGVPFSRIKKIIITHQDIDHIGALPAILTKSQHKIEVFAHRLEKPYIEGEKPLLKMTPERTKKMLEMMPDQQRQRIEAFFSNPPKAKVDLTVEDGEELSDCGGIVIIHTPGHTPGHICIYHKQSKSLVAGDGLIFENDQLLGPNQSTADDIAEAKKSLKKLVAYDIETVICYHAGVYRENARQRIRELAE